MIRTIIAATAAAALLTIPTAASAAVPRFLTSTGTPTAITAIADPPGGLQLTATLTTAAGPVADATVTFTTAGSSKLLCTAVTGADGQAVCAITGGQRTLIRTGSDGIWWARFAGTAGLQPAARAGHI